MNTSIFIKVGACLAWAGAALSSAASANALAITTQAGAFAACSANSSTESKHWCFDPGHKMTTVHTNYVQTIKFVGQPCNTGNCQPDPSTVHTDFVYPVGRKTVTNTYLCDFAGSNNYYDLGTCAC